jgi:hypothetical protein
VICSIRRGCRSIRATRYRPPSGSASVGGGVDHVLRQLAHCKSGPISADPNVVAGIELSVRYLRGWSIALVPRIDTYVVPCTRT